MQRIHTSEIYLLRNHPYNPSIVVSGGFDGVLIFWDINFYTPLQGCILYPTLFIVFTFNSRVLDGTFSDNGRYFAVVDDLGKLCVFSSSAQPSLDEDAFESHEIYL